MEAAAIYLAKQKNLTNPRAYFLKILENIWADDILEIITDKKKERNILERDNCFNAVDEKRRELNFAEFEKLTLSIQNGIEGYVYREYIELCGMETKIQKIAFLGSRKKLICDYLERYPELLFSTKKKSQEKEKNNLGFEEEIKENLIILMDKQKLKNYISEYLTLYEDLIDEKVKSPENVKKSITLDCMTSFLNKTLTLEKLEEIIKKNLI